MPDAPVFRLAGDVQMTYRVNRACSGGAVVLTLSGDIAGDHSAELQVLVGAERRIGSRWSVVTENYLATGAAMASAGVRLHRRHFTAAFSVVVPIDVGDGALVFPAVRAPWAFGWMPSGWK